MIANNEIPYDLTLSHSVAVPTQYADVSVGSSPKIVVENIDGKQCILFYTFLGLTDNSAGFVYVPDETILEKTKIGQSNASTIFYNPIQTKKIKDHWYFISNT